VSVNIFVTKSQRVIKRECRNKIRKSIFLPGIPLEAVTDNKPIDNIERALSDDDDEQPKNLTHSGFMCSELLAFLIYFKNLQEE